ncbi:DUF2271 domain-containing protein [Derxia lacustris]|uniref:DUF2271 domain-containing protein n=1 Tax=Derxia lacustris TaxID=764842 RepID=UPI000A171DC8|nr:DUF2271 domain-containing protein [Derxia lacustris]
MRHRLTLALGALLGTPALAADLSIGVEVPRLDVAEYHRPYVAIWIERADQSAASNVAVWYDLKKRDAEGVKWLKDLRQWWRRSGRELQFPIDGVTSATRPVGKQRLALSDKAAPLAALAPGEYRLNVEAAREAGGHEVVSLAFSWPPQKAEQLQAAGRKELGEITLELKP